MVKEFNGRPPDMVDTAIQQLEANPVAYMGPWFLGLIGLTFMLGILGTQVTKYFSTFGYESLHLFLLVVSCILLLVGQWLTFVIVQWDRCVVNYGDWRRFAEVPWEMVAFPVTSWITIFVSQLFFASRCYTLYGRNKLLFGVLLLGMTASLGMFMVFAATIAGDPFNGPILKKSSISGLAVNVATDIAISGLTLWKLGRGGEMYSPQTQNGLRGLRNMTVEAAVPPTVCVILNIGFYLGMGDTNQVSVFFAAINPALYVWSMMFTLNSRVAIRQKFNAWNDNKDDTLSAGFQFARPRAPNLKSERRNPPASKFAGLSKPYSLTWDVEEATTTLSHHGA